MNRSLIKLTGLLGTFTLLCGLNSPACAQKSRHKKTQTKQTTTASDTPTQDELMATKLMLKYRSLNTISQNVHGNLTMKVSGLELKGEITSTITMAQPNKFAISMKISLLGSEKHGAIYSDGKTVWEWDEDSKQYSESPLATLTKTEDTFSNWMMERNGLDITGLIFLKCAGGGFMSTAKNADKQIVIKNYPMKTVDGVTMYVVPIAMDKTGKKSSISGASISLYLDTKEFLARRYRLNMKQAGATKSDAGFDMALVMFYDPIKTDTTLEDSVFTFTPPEGAMKVESVKPVFDRMGS